MKKRNVAYFIIMMLLTVLSIGCTQEETKEVTQVEEDYIPVEVQSASIQTIYNEITFSGKVNPEKDVMVFPKVPGTRGQVLCPEHSEFCPIFCFLRDVSTRWF